VVTGLAVADRSEDVNQLEIIVADAASVRCFADAGSLRHEFFTSSHHSPTTIILPQNRSAKLLLDPRRSAQSALIRVPLSAIDNGL